MSRPIHTLKLISLCGFSCAALMACAPNQYQSGQYQSDPYQAGQYYADDAAAYGTYASSNGYAATQTVAASRYGDASLRSGCDIQINPCGFMKVVPVYPVYQIITPPPPAPVPVVEAEPIVESIPVYEPAPVIYEEPEVFEPYVYTPRAWPEADIPEPTWKPLRK